MDKSQSEVTDRIRCAIKKKLLELKLFVDDELPDYIMILIANKRSKHHMEKDLSLFLGTQTSDFTTWLWDLVNNLKVSTKIKNAKATLSEEIMHDENLAEPKETKVEEDDVLDYDPAEEGETLCLEELDEPSVTEKVVPEISLTVREIKPNLAIQDNLKFFSNTVTKLPALSKALKTEISQIEGSHNSSINVSKGSLTANSQRLDSVKPTKVYPLPETNTFPTKPPVHKQSNSPMNRINSIKSDFSGGVNSVICVTQRNYGGPAALQANKLLLKAVSEATKSVLNGKDVNEYYKPTPIKNLPVYKSENVIDYEWSEKESVEPKLVSQNLINMNQNFVEETSSSSEKLSVLKSNRIVSMSEKSTPFDCNFEDSNVSSASISDNIPSEKENTITSPHFIVTLDGVDFSSLKRKHSIEEPMEIDANEECFNEDSSEQDSTKKQKLTEKCKYWPTCKNIDNCLYHHPTIPCKCFPDCKFGDKCLYIHPNCKFDSLCSRKDCPYTHCSKRKFTTVSPPAPPVRASKVPSYKMVCKYYPKCTAKSCRFIHPKLCRFGTQCRTPTCRYSHFQVPQRDQLKWVANA